MWLEDKVTFIESISLPVTKYTNVAGVFCLAMMMLVTAVDVLSRFLFNLPITGSIEISGIFLLLTILLGIPYAAARKQHVSIDILVSRFSEKIRLNIESITLLVAVLMFSIIVWRTVKYAVFKQGMHAATPVLDIPLAPFVYVTALAFALLTFVLLIELIQHLMLCINNRKQAVLWVVTAGLVILALYAVAVWARDLPVRLNPVTVGAIGMGMLFVIFLAKMPVFSSLMLLGFVGMCYLRGTKAGLGLLGSSPFTMGIEYHFTVIPLFILMGEFCFYSKLGEDLYDMAYKWLGHLPGGLSMGTVGACGGFAAVCGDSLATAVTMGTVSLPEMKKYKYDSSLAVGCVAAGGTLGVLIPPSLAFILYALLADQSIAVLFIAGILPGILLVSLFMLSIYVRAHRNPALAPPGPKTDMREKMASLKGVWAILVLVVIVIGGMYAGVFTPTEGGGIGAFGSLIIGVARRKLNWQGLISSLLEAGKITAICMGILMGAHIFGYFMAASKLPIALAAGVTQLPVSPLVILAAILIIYLLLGCIMPAIPMLILTVPIFYPVVTGLGYDPIWFGVIMVLEFEMAVITPPMGINVLALQAVAEDVPIGAMFRGVLPFLGMMIVCIGILMLFPDIALILPKLFGKF